MRLTSETLSQVTDLLAIVSAPPIQTTTIRHIEVLLLQPQVLMVVIITSTGGVSKRVFTYERPVDAGLADWAASYLNEALVGKGVGARTLRSRLTDPTLPPTERSFLEGLAPAFTDLAETAEDSLYVEGTARLLSEHRFQDVSQLNALLDMLERRVSLLGVLSAALRPARPLRPHRGENEAPALRGLSLVAANYGLPQRNLGTVSVIGPTRMDYGGGDRRRPGRRAPALPLRRRRLRRRLAADAARLLRGARRRPERRRGGDQEGVPAARARAAPGHEHRGPAGGGQVQGGRRGLRGALRRRPPAPVRRLRARGAALRRVRPELRGLRLASRTCSPRSSARAASRARSGPAAASAAGRCRAPTSSSRSAIDLGQAARGETRRGRVRGRGPLRALPRQRRRARHADRHLPALPGLRPAPGRLAHARSASSCARRCATAAAARGASRSSRAASAPAPARCAETRTLQVQVPAGHRRRPADPAERPRPRRRARRARTATSTWWSACSRTSASCATRRTSTRWSTSPRRSPRSGPRCRCPAWTATCRSRSPPARSRGRRSRCARAGCRRSAAGRTGDLHVHVNVVIPRKLSREQRELLEQLADSLDDAQPADRRGHAVEAQARPGGVSSTQLVRLGIRVRREQAELALAALLPILADGRGGDGARRRTPSSTRSTRRARSCPPRARSARSSATR